MIFESWYKCEPGVTLNIIKTFKWTIGILGGNNKGKPYFYNTENATQVWIGTI